MSTKTVYLKIDSEETLKLYADTECHKVAFQFTVAQGKTAYFPVKIDVEEDVPSEFEILSFDITL